MVCREFTREARGRVLLRSEGTWAPARAAGTLGYGCGPAARGRPHILHFSLDWESPRVRSLRDAEPTASLAVQFVTKGVATFLCYLWWTPSCLIGPISQLPAKPWLCSEVRLLETRESKHFNHKGKASAAA